MPSAFSDSYGGKYIENAQANSWAAQTLTKVKKRDILFPVKTSEYKMFEKKTRILMCPPTYFGIEYEINPWMHVDNPADLKKAHEQWNALYRIYTEKLGWQVELMQPKRGLPDMVFTANGGLVYGNKVVLPQFRQFDRQGETPHFSDWFENAGYELHLTKYDFEGEGDALFAGNTLFVGYPWRTDKASHGELAKLLGVKVVSLQLTDPRFYHLDTAFTVVNDETVAIYPGAFTKESVEAVYRNVRSVIEASYPDALKYGLNAMSDGKNIIISDEAYWLIEKYQKLGFNVHPTPIGEFQKSGGGVKCLTLKLNGNG